LSERVTRREKKSEKDAQGPRLKLLQAKALSIFGRPNATMKVTSEISKLTYFHFIFYLNKK